LKDTLPTLLLYVYKALLDKSIRKAQPKMDLPLKRRFQQRVKAHKGNTNTIIENWAIDETA